MQERWLPRARLTGFLVPLALGAVLVCLVDAGSASAASAWKLAKTEGEQVKVACASAERCVLVGGEELHGDILPVRDGRPGVGWLERSTAAVYDVSCLRGGCIALAQPCDIRGAGAPGCEQLGNPAAGRPGALLYRLSPSGAIRHTIRLNLPQGMSLGRIVCSSLTRCTMAGLDVKTRPMRVDLALWSGGRLTLHQVKLPTAASDGYLQGLGCWGAVCETVGFATNPHAGYGDKQGYIVTSRNAAPIHTAYLGSTAEPGFELYGAACVSASTCYAVGYTPFGESAAFAVHDGVPGSPITTQGLYQAIACQDSTCVMAGYMTPEGVNHTVGGIGELRDGVVTAETEVSNDDIPFNSVALAGGRVIASAFTGLATDVVSGDLGDI